MRMLPMDLIILAEVIRDEQKAEDFLRAKGILKTFTQCPYCGNIHFGKVRRNFFQCYRCKKWGQEKIKEVEVLKIRYQFLVFLKEVVN